MVLDCQPIANSMDFGSFQPMELGEDYPSDQPSDYPIDNPSDYPVGVSVNEGFSAVDDKKAYRKADGSIVPEFEVILDGSNVTEANASMLKETSKITGIKIERQVDGKTKTVEDRGGLKISSFKLNGKKLKTVSKVDAVIGRIRQEASYDREGNQTKPEITKIEAESEVPAEYTLTQAGSQADRMTVAQPASNMTITFTDGTDGAQTKRALRGADFRVDDEIIFTLDNGNATVTYTLTEADLNVDYNAVYGSQKVRREEAQKLSKIHEIGPIQWTFFGGSLLALVSLMLARTMKLYTSKQTTDGKRSLRKLQEMGLLLFAPSVESFAFFTLGMEIQRFVMEEILRSDIKQLWITSKVFVGKDFIDAPKNVAAAHPLSKYGKYTLGPWLLVLKFALYILFALIAGLMVTLAPGSDKSAIWYPAPRDVQLWVPLLAGFSTRASDGWKKTLLPRAPDNDKWKWWGPMVAGEHPSDPSGAVKVEYVVEMESETARNRLNNRFEADKKQAKKETPIILEELKVLKERNLEFGGAATEYVKGKGRAAWEATRKGFLEGARSVATALKRGKIDYNKKEDRLLKLDKDKIDGTPIEHGLKYTATDNIEYDLEPKNISLRFAGIDPTFHPRKSPLHYKDAKGKAQYPYTVDEGRNLLLTEGGVFEKAHTKLLNEKISERHTTEKQNFTTLIEKLNKIKNKYQAKKKDTDDDPYLAPILKELRNTLTVTVIGDKNFLQKAITEIKNVVPQDWVSDDEFKEFEDSTPTKTPEMMDEDELAKAKAAKKDVEFGKKQKQK